MVASFGNAAFRNRQSFMVMMQDNRIAQATAKSVSTGWGSRISTLVPRNTTLTPSSPYDPLIKKNTETHLTGKIDNGRIVKAVAPTVTMTTTTINYTYNSANQLVTEQTVGGNLKTYSYDANGNNTQIVETDPTPTTVKTITMTYDELNRQLTWGDGTSTETTVYRGAEWHRHTLDSNDGTTSTKLGFVYDGPNVVLDREWDSGTSTWSNKRQYVTPFLDQNLSMTEVSSGNDFYYTQNGLGSVTNVTDSSGTVKNTYGYSAFGEDYSPVTSSTVAQRYQYTGRELNALSKTQYSRYRTYDSGVGRFISRDPAASPEWNLYGYVRNQPTSRRDAYGLYDNLTHKAMVELVAELLGIPPKVAEKIVEANVAMDDPNTFVSNVYAHALSYGDADDVMGLNVVGPALAWAPSSKVGKFVGKLAADYANSEYNRLKAHDDTGLTPKQVRAKWQKYVTDKRQRIREKLAESCCDCSVLKDIGQLTHAIQDQYYHSFNTWMGWHWNMAPMIGKPIVEEAALGQALKTNGARKLRNIVGAMNRRWKQRDSKYHKDPNSAYHNLDRAVNATRRMIAGIKSEFGEECWKTLMDACSKK